MTCSIFEQWIVPFKDLGLTTATMRSFGGTNHASFDAVAVQGLSFIQDPLEYFTHTHHTNIDVYERVSRADLMHAASGRAGPVRLSDRHARRNSPALASAQTGHEHKRRFAARDAGAFTNWQSLIMLL